MKLTLLHFVTIYASAGNVTILFAIINEKQKFTTAKTVPVLHAQNEYCMKRHAARTL
jgi:hypothetical protein